MKKWWSYAGSNRGPPACKAGALPAELHPQVFYNNFKPMVGLDGLEPSTPALSRRCSNQLSYRPRKLFSPRALTSRQFFRSALKGPLFLLLVSSRLNKPISVSTKTKQIQDLNLLLFL